MREAGLREAGAVWSFPSRSRRLLETPRVTAVAVAVAVALLLLLTYRVPFRSGGWTGEKPEGRT
ncbi:hypothetical protein OCJ37_02490 [Xanthomonas sp. AM6]|uniref:hypothetical protein n=1 Tax=Xanthomonas sp. AM6 TaxID=2982531 RepID=UPI0021D81FA1|nr:hypothetical protein [Xanthomonas sp. AM6]UYB52851.1 hypothetical protein OCJ37_02490 [Xanthomonas sp. AM6]